MALLGSKNLPGSGPGFHQKRVKTCEIGEK